MSTGEVGVADHRPDGASGVEFGAVGFGCAPGSFGELLQGALPGTDTDFLVTLPITLSSQATFRPDPADPGVTVEPGYKRKSQAVAVRALRALGVAYGGQLRIDSRLPEGKGLASSSADLVATVRAVADAYGARFDESSIEDLIRGIEPSDGVMYPGIVSFHHRRVRLRQRLGFLPSLTVVAHDTGGVVDTVSFNRAAPAYTDRQRQEYQQLHERICAAVPAGDLAEVGRVATRSAELSVRRRPRPDFAAMRRFCAEVAGLGLVITHSGTHLGILLDERAGDHAHRVAHARELCRGLPGSVAVYRSVGGGAAERQETRT